MKSVLLEKAFATKSGYVAEIVYHKDTFHRCGYVGLQSSHFLYGVDCMDDCDGVGYLFNVHGGVTYSDYRGDGIFWWIGFDASHSSDKTKYHLNGVERTLDFMMGECENLSAQIKKLENSAVEFYIRYKKGEKILEVDHNRMIMLAMGGDNWAKRYIDIIKIGVER